MLLLEVVHRCAKLQTSRYIHVYSSAYISYCELCLSFGVMCASHIHDMIWYICYIFILQAQALKMALESKNISANVYVGMRYWYPFTEEAIHQVSTLTFMTQ